MINRTYAIVIALLFIFTISAAQDEFFHITTYDGLSQANVTCILKDKEGFLWFGTRRGLNKYDGHLFRKYFYNHLDSNSIGSDHIIDIIEAPDGSIFIATNGGGIAVYDKEKDFFQNITNNPGRIYPALTDVQIPSFYLLHDSLLWIGTYLNGVNCLNIKSRKLSKYLEGVPIAAITGDIDGNIWVATKINDQLLKYNVSKNIFEETEIPAVLSVSKHSRRVRTLLGDSHGNMWVGTDGDGLIKYNIKNRKLYEYMAKDGVLPNNVIYALEEDREGNIWVGHENAGIVIFSGHDNGVKYIRANKTDKYGLNDESVYSIYSAMNGDIYIGTFSGGVNVLCKRRESFKPFRHLPNVKESICDYSVLTFAEGPQGNIWIGTDGGGINVFKPATGKVIKGYNAKNSALTSNIVGAILFDSANNAWIGTWRGGLLKYFSKDDKFVPSTKLPGCNIKILSDHAWSLFHDSKQQLWIGEHYYGIVRFGNNKMLGQYQAMPTNPKALSNHGVRVIFEDKHGNVWIGTGSGLNRYDAVHDNFVRYLHDPSDSNSISNNFIHAATSDNNGNIWFGTAHGLDMYNAREDNFVSYPSPRYFGNGDIFSVLCDEKGFLWLITQNYLCQFDPLTEKVVFFDYQAKNSASFKDQNGNMYFNNMDGFIVFNPANISTISDPPEIVFTNFYLYNKEVPIKEGTFLDKHINYMDAIELPYKIKVFSIEFASLNIFNSHKNKYKYRLVGLEDEWNEVENNGIATYTSLAPGKYIFKVQASDNERTWNVKGRDLVITIIPPFYLRLWFIISVILFLGIGLFAFIKHRERSLLQINKVLEEKVNSRTRIIQEQNIELKEINSKLSDYSSELNKHQNKLDKLVKFRTHELEQAKLKAEESDQLKSAFLANMSHEIRTPLNAIVGFALLLEDKGVTPKRKKEFIKHININAELLLILIEDILDLSRIESNQLRIRFNVFNINDLMQEIYHSALIDPEKPITFKINLETPENQQIETDKLRLKQIISNLVQNALKFTEKGFIEIATELKDGNLLIHVTDTGVGIEYDKLEKIFDRFYKSYKDNDKVFRGTGLGLSISKKLSELLGMQIKVKSKLEEGSKFTITVPSIYLRN